MARKPARVRQRDLVRALKAALQAGLQVASARIEADGAMQLVFATARGMASSAEPNEWDS